MNYKQTFTKEYLEKLYQWVVLQLVELEDLGAERTEMVIRFPYYMRYVLPDYLRGRFFDPALGDADRLVLYGVEAFYDSPTHDVYVYIKDWCMRTKQNWRRIMPSPQTVRNGEI